MTISTDASGPGRARGPSCYGPVSDSGLGCGHRRSARAAGRSRRGLPRLVAGRSTCTTGNSKLRVSVEFPVSWRCTGTLSGIGSGKRRRRPAASGTGFSKCGARSARWSPSPSHNDRGVGRLVTVTVTVTELRSFSAESLRWPVIRMEMTLNTKFTTFAKCFRMF